MQYRKEKPLKTEGLTTWILMMKRYECITGPESVQGSPEWKEFRMGKIGASMAPAIMGVGYETPLQLWERLIRGEEIKPNAAMERGKALESKAREWLNTQGHKFEPVVVARTDYPEIIASLDGYYLPPPNYDLYTGGPIICEIKCMGKADHELAKQGIIPECYIPQVQHQMDVVNVHMMLFVSFNGDEGVIVMAQRDTEYCSLLLASELAFLASLCDFVPPKPTERDWTEIVDPIMQEKVEMYRELVSKAHWLEREIGEIRQFLISKVTHNRMKFGNIKMQKILKKGAIDYKMLVNDYKIMDVERFRKEPVESWRIDI